MARNRPTGDLTGSQKTGGAGKKPTTKKPPRYVTPSAQGSQGLPTGDLTGSQKTGGAGKKPTTKRPPRYVTPSTGHSSFFNLSNSMR